MPRNNKDGSLPSTHARGEGKKKRKKPKAGALALLRPKPNAHVLITTITKRGGRGMLGRVSWKLADTRW